MTIEDAARPVVSRPYIYRLLGRGVLFDTLPKRPCACIDIDVRSMDEYMAHEKSAQRAYLAGDREDTGGA